MNEIIQALLALSSDLKEVKAFIYAMKQRKVDYFKESWIDGQDVLLALNISPRTLQTLRDNGTLPFSRISGKFYYKVSDLETLLDSNYTGNLKKSDRNGTK